MFFENFFQHFYCASYFANPVLVSGGRVCEKMCSIGGKTYETYEMGSAAVHAPAGSESNTEDRLHVIEWLTAYKVTCLREQD